MGKNNKPKPEAAANANYTTALTEAKTISPYEQRRADFDNSVLDWANSGDYRQPPKEARVFFNFFDPAERRRHAEMEMGAGAQGNAALGGASPTALALDRQNRLDESAEDAAKGYQETAAGLVSGALSDEGDLSRLDQTRRLGVLGATQSVYQNERSRPEKPKWWQRLMSGFASGAGAAATA
jgi:hypothetical protein